MLAVVTMRYKAWRSGKDNYTHVICREDEFDKLPFPVTHMGPWLGSKEGDVDALKPHYRAFIEEQGFCVVFSSLVMFKPEG
jgi:hypothetical protein